jgi:hypothetical protein
MSAVNRATLVAAAVLVYATSNVIHEGAHGLTCVLVGGEPRQLSAAFVECGLEMTPGARPRFLAAAGSLANLLAAGLAAVGLRLVRAPGTARYLCWLSMTVNLLQATGYDPVHACPAP